MFKILEHLPYVGVGLRLAKRPNSSFLLMLAKRAVAQLVEC